MAKNFKKPNSLGDFYVKSNVLMDGTNNFVSGCKTAVISLLMTGCQAELTTMVETAKLWIIIAKKAIT